MRNNRAELGNLKLSLQLLQLSSRLILIHQLVVLDTNSYKYQQIEILSATLQYLWRHKIVQIPFIYIRIKLFGLYIFTREIKYLKRLVIRLSYRFFILYSQLIFHNQQNINRFMLAYEKNKDVIEQVKKLSSRIDNLADTKVKFYDYIIKTQQMFTSQSKTIKNQIEIFEDAITKKSFYSISKCQSMKKLVYIYKHFITFVENLSKLNQVQLKRIDIGSGKQEERLKKKNESFIKVIGQYAYSQQGYNKNFGDYQYLCGKLDQMMGKFKSFEDPINFYNLHMANDFSKSLQKKYHQCQNKETSLISLLQLLDQKRKSLSENLKDIKQDYVVLLHFHMTNFVNAATCLTDASKDDMHEMSSSITLLKTQGDVFSEQIQKFNKKYGKGVQNEDQGYSDLKELFMSKSCDAEITSDQRLFLDRCQTFIQKKYESVQQFLYLQKRFVQEIQNQTFNCQKINKDFVSIQKNVFRSNGTDDFKKKIRKYFGEGILNIADLCFIVVDVPRRRYEKIGKMFQSHDEKLKKILQKKEDELKKFKKRISLILAEHTAATKSLQNNIVSVNQFKNNVQKTFAIFKSIFEQFNKNQQQMDRQFEDVIKKIIALVQRQSSHCLIKYTLNKQKQKFLFNIFNKFNSDGQIVQIVKQDTRYQILFNDALRPCLFDEFKSQIEKKKFQETRKVLQKKQHQAKGMIAQRQIGCCGMQSNRIKKQNKITSHNASILIRGSDEKPGNLDILNKGLTFQEKKKTPFGQKVQIAIPTKQMFSYNSKVLQDGRTAVQIFTGMGPICFCSDEANEILQSLDKNLGTKIVNKQQNDSKREKSSDTSSFLKQNNTSTEYKISFEKSVLAPENKPKPSKNNTNQDALLLKKLIEAWKSSTVFSELFSLQSTQESGGSMRADYKYRDDLNKFLLREKKNAKVEAAKNFLFLIYEWKVSFPDMPMLKSFIHGEQIRVEISKQVVRIIIIERNRGESHLFVRKTFYNQIDKMNKKLSDLIVEICEREGQVVIEQQRPDSQESTLVLDLENLALDKEEVQSKHDNRFGVKRAFSGSVALDSEKGSKVNAGDF